MSAEATGWVFRHSPTTGVMRLVHLAMADSVNDQNDNEFWMSQANLAKKAGSSRSATQGALRWLIDLGYITLLEDNSKAGKPNRYRFEFLEGVPGDKAPPARSEGTQVPGDRAQTQRTTQEIPIRTRIDELFKEFWAVYPKKTERVRALSVFERVVMKAPKGTRSEKAREIIKGAERYASACRGKDKQYIKGPAGWLRDGRWEDEVAAQGSIEDDQARLIREYNSVKYV